MRDSGDVKNLVHFRKYSQNKLVIAHLNINSLRNETEVFAPFPANISTSDQRCFNVVDQR